MKDLEGVRRQRENDNQQMLRDVEDTKNKTENVGLGGDDKDGKGKGCDESEISMTPAVAQM